MNLDFLPKSWSYYGSKKPIISYWFLKLGAEGNHCGGHPLNQLWVVLALCTHPLQKPILGVWGVTNWKCVFSRKLINSILRFQMTELTPISLYFINIHSKEKNFWITCRRLTHHQNQFKRESITRLPIFPGVKGCAIFSSEILRLDALLVIALRHDEMVMDFWWAATQLDFASLIWKVKLSQNDTFFSRENATQNKAALSLKSKNIHSWWCTVGDLFHSLSNSNGHLDNKLNAFHALKSKWILE